MLESSDLVAFVAATDLDRARLFYEQTLGLRVLEHSDFAVVLDANGTMLRVTAVGHAANAGYTVLGWRVRDIGASVRALATRSVAFPEVRGHEPRRPRHLDHPPGDKVAWFAYPDENTLSLTQFG
jgi:catechol 2,3-dioxygenase-like lactoylglutathione lyase family enzyme